MAEEETQKITNQRGTELFCKYWKPNLKEQPRGLVFICHGYAEHILWYDHLSQALTKEGILTFGHDHIGHGQSMGDQGLIKNLNDCVTDVLHHIDIMKEKYSNLPIFVLGHSMGGAIALKSSLVKPDLLKGLVLLGPALKANPNVAKPHMKAMAKLFGKVLPSLKVGKLDPETVCKDKEVVKKYVEDPLIYHDGMKAATAASCLSMFDELAARVTDISIPFLIIHGREDKLTELSGSEMLYEKSSSSDKTFKIYENCYHQVHNEPDGNREKCTLEVVDWITSRI